jgi:hypothetical protein
MYLCIFFGGGGCLYKRLARDPSHRPRNSIKRLQNKSQKVVVLLSVSIPRSGGLLRSFGETYPSSTALNVLHFLNVFIKPTHSSHTIYFSIHHNLIVTVKRKFARFAEV